MLTDVDIRSTGRNTSDEFSPSPMPQENDADVSHNDKTSSGGGDTIVPEVFESEKDDMIVENESTRGGKYNLRPNPTPNYTDDYRYSDTNRVHLFSVSAYYFDHETNLTSNANDKPL